MLAVLPEPVRVELPAQMSAACWSPEGSLLVAACVAGPVFLVDSTSGALQRELLLHQGGALAAAWSPDGKRVATGGQDGTVRVYRAGEWSLVGSGAAGGARVEHLAWSPTGRHLASAAGRVVRLWSPDLEQAGGFEEHPGAVSALSWEADGGHAVSTCQGALFRSAPGRERLAGQLPYEGPIIAAAPGPSWQPIEAVRHDGTVYGWWLEHRDHLPMPGHQSKVRALAWSPDGGLLASGDGQDIALWRLGGPSAARGQPQVLRGHAARVTSLAFRRDGSLLSTGEDGALRGWLPARRQCTFRVEVDEPLFQLVVSPDGRRAVARGRHRRAYLFQLPAPRA